MGLDVKATAATLLGSLGAAGAEAYVADQLASAQGQERTQWEAVAEAIVLPTPDPTARAARLQAALLTTKRFAGRRELEDQASRQGNDIALAKLRMAIGFRGAEQELAAAQEAHARAVLMRVVEGMSLRTEWLAEGNGDEATEARQSYPRAYPAELRAEAAKLLFATPKQREVWAIRHRAAGSTNDRASAAYLAWRIAPDALTAAASKASGRRQGASGGADPLTTRAEKHAESVVVGRRIRELVASAKFRRAAHAHHTSFTIVPEGQEGALADTSSVRDGKWFRTTSEHHWRASRALFSPAVRELNENAPYGVVYLRPDLRVVQGRGTALKVEHLTPAAGKRKVSWK